MSLKRIVVVLGMHRSGTSAITRGLEVLGVGLGERLLAAESGNNEKGFWEDIDVTAFNVDLLAALGRDWHSLAPVLPAELQHADIQALRLRAAQLLRGKVKAVGILGLKDPRMCRLMPFWLSVFEHLQLDVSYVIASRNPMSVAASLYKRNGMAAEKSHLLWYEHMVCAMQHTAACRRVVIDYDRMLADPASQLKRVSAHLQLPFEADSKAYAEYTGEFLEASLRHSEYTAQDLSLDAAITRSVTAFYELLSAMACDQLPDDQQVRQQIDGHFDLLISRYPEYRYMRTLEKKADELQLRLEQAEEIAANLAHQADEARQLLSSRSHELNALTQAHGHLQHACEQQQAKLSALDQALDEKVRQCQHLQHNLAASRSGRVALANLSRAAARRLGGERLQQRYLRYRLQRSGLFDVDYYRQNYPDIAQAGIDPLTHYLHYGWKEGRDPIQAFSTSRYLERYPDVQASALNPLLHYLHHGYREGRLVPAVGAGHARLEPHQLPWQRLWQLMRLVIGQPALIGKFAREARHGGLRHALALAHLKTSRTPRTVFDAALAVAPPSREDLFNVVPFYVNPHAQQDCELPAMRVAIHLHLFYPDMAEDCINYLRHVPVPYDLYLSVPEHLDAKQLAEDFQARLPQLKQIVARAVPNRGRDLAPMIIEFGQALAGYDVIAHFHSKKSPHKASLKNWFNELMNALCAGPREVSQILDLFSADASVVYPAGRQVKHWDQSGWSDNKALAAQVLERSATGLHIDDFAQVEFPQGSMFWARAAALREFLTLPLTYEDFAQEPISADATLAHALERLILVFASQHPGRNYRIESAALSDEPKHFYEEQIDYSGSIVHDSIKVLAYYLPQFHPTPENDEWHGKGFTEWHKVAAANPLFQGHYQQHIPHADIGYYHLDSPQQLAQQAEMMRQAGVHGMIFYHYWFTGRLILEKPAQMLLDNPQIDMPFSFCWANENWTRRWDGNEKEILLGQSYSPEDARNFICYLLPFFKDERYIKVEGRPLLFVYRPSAMEHTDEYLRIWREECEREGMPAPYVVATLTRGATAPQDYGMDAAVERVLHDWTDGAVADIRPQLKPYRPLNGSVLDYAEVADHYMHKPLDSSYLQFRSLVPTWDNTARYGSEAILLHDFTTRKFQEWLEHLVQHSLKQLPADRRFVVINAWNEWAEGAHLEPDTRFGYGYLNAIGRALSGHAFDDYRHLQSRLDTSLVLRLELGKAAREQLASDERARSKFSHCLAASSLLDKCTLQTDEPLLTQALQSAGIDCAAHTEVPPAFILRFDTPYLFTPDSLESMLLMALRHPGFAISANLLNDPTYQGASASRNFEIGYWARAGLEISPASGELLGYKVASAAACFRLPCAEPGSELALPTIATVMRFHHAGDYDLLANALLSLAAQAGCRVRLHLAAQDLDEAGKQRLQHVLANTPWDADCEPLVKHYRSSESNRDLRSLMLNETLKSVAGGYAAFLDYDDILFPDAYRQLSRRLQRSGKNATFARVYATRVDGNSGLILQRGTTYSYGHSYEEFVRLNHAPLHSFMLNLDQLDLSQVHYHADMKYMEDYYLTLQLFSRDGSDWAALRDCAYIGDYIHRVGGSDSHTLALEDDTHRQTLLRSPEYLVCEQRITELRRMLAG